MSVSSKISYCTNMHNAQRKILQSYLDRHKQNGLRTIPFEFRKGRCPAPNLTDSQ